MESSKGPLRGMQWEDPGLWFWADPMPHELALPTHSSRGLGKCVITPNSSVVSAAHIVAGRMSERECVRSLVRCLAQRDALFMAHYLYTCTMVKS